MSYRSNGDGDLAWPNVSPVGLVLGGTFFGLALTPSLVPRDPSLLALAGGALAALGHEMGGAAQWIWRFFGLPVPPRGWRVPIRLLALGLAAVMVALCLAQATHWQNIVRRVTEVPLVESVYPGEIAGIALGVALLFWVVARVIGVALRRIGSLLSRVMPPRISAILGIFIVGWVVWGFVEGTLVTWVFRAADSSFAAADARLEPDVPRPQDPVRTGSPASLVKWEEMGRRGREFVATAPTREEIAAFTGGPAMDPIRVYVGRLASESPTERAEIALRELIRAGGFERSALVVMVPVGTGWMDPGGHDTLDFMLGGDVATVAVQYSYLTSFLSLIDDANAGVEQERELFKVVYDYWRTLPKDGRPALYVHGLSQGAFNSQATLPILDMMGDPIQGALWAGSPFFSRFWEAVRDGRDPASPAWRPRWGNGSLVRTMDQQGGLDLPGFEPWGPTRLVFLNYGSDPIVNFTFSSAFRRPAWLGDARPPDVAPELTWYPVVTMVQLAIDAATSLRSPRFGHWYVAEDYIDGWAAVVEPEGWSSARADALKRIFETRGPAF